MSNSPINTDNSAHTVAVLAVQGAFLEHRLMLEKLGARVIELRQARDLEQSFDRLVLPGGESTVQAKLLREQNMLEPCLLYTSPSPRDLSTSRMPSSA